MSVLKLSAGAFAAVVLAVSAYGMTQVNPNIVKQGFHTIDTVKASPHTYNFQRGFKHTQMCIQKYRRERHACSVRKQSLCVLLVRAKV